MIEAFAALFAGYAGYAGWPWWTAALVGALSGFQVANARLYKQSRARIEAGEQGMPQALLRWSIVGVGAGAAVCVAVYFGVRWVMG